MTEAQYEQIKELLVDYDRTIGTLGKEQAVLNSDILAVEKQVYQLKKQLLISDLMIMILVVVLIIVVKKKK